MAPRKRIRARATLAAAVALAALAWAGTSAGAAGASSGKASRCEKIAAEGQHWGVYVEKGNVSCATAGKVLAGVLDGKGKNVDVGPVDVDDEYIRYDGWACPYFQMGVVSCQYGDKPMAHPRRAIFALDCRTVTGQPACPARAEL
jgi:hypothetical protein